MIAIRLSNSIPQIQMKYATLPHWLGYVCWLEDCQIDMCMHILCFLYIKYFTYIQTPTPAPRACVLTFT